MNRIQRVGVIGVVAASLMGAFFASSSVSAYSGVEYQSQRDWSIGVVAAVNGEGELVSASTVNDNYVGVVVSKAEGRIEVANDGVVQVLVTDADGAVASGTRLGISSVTGVAGAWVDGTVLGVAQGDPANWQQTKLDDGSSALIGNVRVQLLTDGASNGSTPVSEFFAALEKTASGVAGRPVDTWRIVTALLIGLGGLILAFGLLFISSRESFFSIGRNPMASKIIMRGLWKVVALSVGILCLTLTASYLIVRIA